MSWQYRNLLSVDYIVVHCSATKPEQDIGADEIRLWHRQRGWLDIGYHKVIRRDGTVEDGRPLHAQGAHARGFNDVSIGICLVGGINARGKPANNYTTEQLTALAALLDSLQMRHPRANVLGHRDLPNVAKACPCFDVKPWYARLRKGDASPPT